MNWNNKEPKRTYINDGLNSEVIPNSPFLPRPGDDTSGPHKGDEVFIMRGLDAYQNALLSHQEETCVK